MFKSESLIKSLAALQGKIYVNDFSNLVQILNREIQKYPILKGSFINILSVENQLSLSICIPKKFIEKIDDSIYFPYHIYLSLYIIGVLNELVKKLELNLNCFQNLIIFQKQFILSIPIAIINSLLIYPEKEIDWQEILKKISILNYYRIQIISQFIKDLDKLKIYSFYFKENIDTAQLISKIKKIIKGNSECFIIVNKRLVSKILPLLTEKKINIYHIIKTNLKRGRIIIISQN